MRIISGRYKGLILKRPAGIRPTSDKVREAIFNILGEKVLDAGCLDLYAGSGAFGIEALSRAAGRVVFVEKSRDYVRILRENLKTLKASGVGLHAMDACRYISSISGRENFDLIFLDPPYYKDEAKKCLLELNEYDILSPNALVVVEHFKKDMLPDKMEKIELVRSEIYGDTKVSFYEKNRDISGKF